MNNIKINYNKIHKHFKIQDAHTHIYIHLKMNYITKQYTKLILKIL